MSNDITVSFGVDLSDLSDGLQAAGDQVSEAAGAMRASLDDASNSGGQAIDDLFGGIGTTVQQASQSFGDLAAAAQQQADLQQTLDGSVVASRAQFYNQLNTLDAGFNAQVVQNSQRTADNTTVSWNRMGNAIRTSFSNSLAGMIVGTTSFQQAIQQLSQRVLSQFINLGTQMVWNWLFNEDTKTAATVAGAGARATAEQSANAGSIADSAAKAVSSIMNYSFETFAGVFAFLSDLLGPGAAGPAAAAESSVAGAAGSIAFAERGFDVPRNTLAFLHKDEMVLPASLAGRVRDGGAIGAAASAPVVNVNYSAQGRMNAAEILDHSHTIARAVARELRHFNPQLRAR